MNFEEIKRLENVPVEVREHIISIIKLRYDSLKNNLPTIEDKRLLKILDYLLNLEEMMIDSKATQSMIKILVSLVEHNDISNNIELNNNIFNLIKMFIESNQNDAVAKYFETVTCFNETLRLKIDKELQKNPDFSLDNSIKDNEHYNKLLKNLLLNHILSEHEDQVLQVLILSVSIDKMIKSLNLSHNEYYHILNSYNNGYINVINNYLNNCLNSRDIIENFLSVIKNILKFKNINSEYYLNVIKIYNKCLLELLIKTLIKDQNQITLFLDFAKLEQELIRIETLTTNQIINIIYIYNNWLIHLINKNL